jgi:uracil-DNA glycosylase
MTDDPHHELAELSRDLRAHLAVQAAWAADQPDGPPPLESLTSILGELGPCRRCGLARGRRNLVFGEGNSHADLVFVGEAPGADEDRQGRPFVGAAGGMLTRMITHVLRLERDEVYICNVLKCQPPGNRDPEQGEVATCTPFLERQLAAISPRLIVALGRFAAQHLLDTEQSIANLRGTTHDRGGVAVVVTYHPAYLLRNPADKRKAMDDLLLIRKQYEELTGRELAAPRQARRG